MLSIEEYKAIYDAAPDGYLVVAENGEIRSANAQIEPLFGWTVEELVGRKVEVLIPEALRSRHLAHRAGFAADPHNRPMGVGLDLQGAHKDGSTFPVEVSLSPWRQADGRLCVICSVRDITAYRRLRNFSEGALLASEDERKRIARELHDDTAQRLATLILSVRALAGTDDTVERRRMFEQVRAEIVDAAEGVKRMSRGLRPPEIEELGLVHAVQAHARSVQEATGFVVETDLDVVDPFLDRNAKLALYRIVQEALSNARRHSGADGAVVRLGREGGDVITEVLDVGSGFARPGGPAGDDSGLGLVGMHERAVMIGGRLVIETKPGGGTRVRLSVPARAASDG